MAVIAFTLMTVSAALFAGCNKGGGGSSSTSDLDVTKVAELSMSPGATAGPYTLDVPNGSVSITISADGVSASDMDISNITDPNGVRLINEYPASDTIGFNLTQGFGQSSIEFTMPHTGSYTLTPGTYTFYVTHYYSVDGRARDVSIYTSVKSSQGSTINSNIFLVSIHDYQGAGDPTLAAILDRYYYMLGRFGLSAGDTRIIELNDDSAARLTHIDPDIDTNQNGQSDDMDELLRRASEAGNDYVNFFLVKSIGTGGILGIAGGIPCTQIIRGTSHSGVVINVFGGLSTLTPQDISLQGDTMAHEMGHCMGLFHTTERGGSWFDPIADTPQCDAATYDLNGDGVVSAAECQSADGANIMFWAAASFSQETATGTQKHVLSLNPVAR